MKVLTYIVLIALILAALNLSGQVGIGTTTPNPSAVLDVYSPDFGLLIPRITTDRRLSMAPVNGMMVYDVDYKQFYVYENDLWISIGTGDPTWVRNVAEARTYLANPNDVVGLGTTSPVTSAKLDIRSTTQGLMIPKMTQTQMNAIGSPATGLLVFNSTANSFYYFNGSAWTMLVASSAGMLKDADGDTKIEVEKNPDEDIIRFTLAGSEKMTLTGNRLEMPKGDNPNLFIGMGAGKSNTTGYGNTALGDSTLRSNTEGYYNTATGNWALRNNTTGRYNAAYGASTLLSNTTGRYNVAYGNLALSSNVSGYYNIAVGYGALNSNTADSNTAVGHFALSANSSGSNNTALGFEALMNNTTGKDNLALGSQALHENSTGSGNIALGIAAQHGNSSGSRNIALGTAALSGNPEFNDLIAIGDSALYLNGTEPFPPGYYPDPPEGNIAIGSGALRSNTLGISNIAIGKGSLYYNTYGHYCIAIGDSALSKNSMNKSYPGYGNGNGNLAIGTEALKNIDGGYDNVAIGYKAFSDLQSIGGSEKENVAIGSLSAEHVEKASNLTAVGYMSLWTGKPVYGTVAIGSNAHLSYDSSEVIAPNVAVGLAALYGNTAGLHNYYGNVAVGAHSMYNILSGSRNAAVGYATLYENETGNGNSVLGNKAMAENISGNSNVAIGIHALHSATQQSNLVAIGDSALYNNNYTGTTNPEYATKNTAVGSKALYTNTTGNLNTAVGFKALYANNTGTNNTAVGSEALSTISNTNYNSAYGDKAMKSNTGSFNVGIGASALQAGGAGGKNAAVGYSALYANTAGDENVAVGYNALNKNTTGDYNVGVGSTALYNNNTGTKNVAIGHKALGENTTPNSMTSNIAIGYLAGGGITTGYGNVLIGEETGRGITTGINNVWIGKMIGTTGPLTYSNSIAIGLNAYVDANYKTRIGNNQMTSIGGEVGWTSFSDGRFKRNIREDVPGMNFIALLKPVTFTVDIAALDAHYYPGMEVESNPAAGQIRYTGFVAQDVDEAAKSLGYDFSGVDKSSEILGLRYAEFVVPLVKAVQEQQAVIENQQKQIDELLLRISKLEN